MAKTPWEWLCLDVVDSTNMEARRQAEKGHKGRLVIVADCQTAGRGRRRPDGIPPERLH